MKRLVAAVVLGVAVMASAAVVARPPTEPAVDKAQVEALIDARLQVILAELVARRARGG